MGVLCYWEGWSYPYGGGGCSFNFLGQPMAEREGKRGTSQKPSLKIRSEKLQKTTGLKAASAHQRFCLFTNDFCRLKEDCILEKRGLMVGYTSRRMKSLGEMIPGRLAVSPSSVCFSYWLQGFRLQPHISGKAIAETNLKKSAWLHSMTFWWISSWMGHVWGCRHQLNLSVGFLPLFSL